MPLRSHLYAPGNNPKLLDKVWAAGADAVILDLEDAVPAGEKERARDSGQHAVDPGHIQQAVRGDFQRGGRSKTLRFEHPIIELERHHFPVSNPVAGQKPGFDPDPSVVELRVQRLSGGDYIGLRYSGSARDPENSIAQHAAIFAQPGITGRHNTVSRLEIIFR